MSRQWVLVGCIVAGIGLGAWALTRFAPPPEGTEVGDRAADFRTLRLTDNDSVSIRSGYAGNVTLVNVWATWCIPCRAEMPSMERAYRMYASRGFRIAAVSIDEGDAEKVRAFGRELGLSFDLLHDPSGAVQQAYGAIGVPQSVLIDRDGRIAHVSMGAEAWDSDRNRALIEQLLGGGK
jgi:peroxiredoxin